MIKYDIIRIMRRSYSGITFGFQSKDVGPIPTLRSKFYRILDILTGAPPGGDPMGFTIT